MAKRKVSTRAKQEAKPQPKAPAKSTLQFELEQAAEELSQRIKKLREEGKYQFIGLRNIGLAVISLFINIEYEVRKVEASGIRYRGYRRLKAAYFILRKLAYRFGYRPQPLPKKKKADGLFDPTVKIAKPRRVLTNERPPSHVFDPNVRLERTEEEVPGNAAKKPNHHIFQPPVRKRTTAAPAQRKGQEEGVVLASSTGDDSFQEEVRQYKEGLPDIDPQAQAKADAQAAAISNKEANPNNRLFQPK